MTGALKKINKGERTMHIIFLEGNHGSGKTTTLQMVYAVLKLLNAEKINDSPFQGSKKDFEAELSFQKKTVAIFSKGDTQEDCIKAIEKYAEKKVDVLIMAHTSNLLPLTGNQPTASHTTVTLQKTVQSEPYEYKHMSTNIGDCLNVIINILMTDTVKTNQPA